MTEPHPTVTPTNWEEDIDEIVQNTKPGTCENCGDETDVGGYAERAFCGPECAKEYDNE